MEDRLVFLAAHLEVAGTEIPLLLLALLNDVAADYLGHPDFVKVLLCLAQLGQPAAEELLLSFKSEIVAMQIER